MASDLFTSPGSEVSSETEPKTLVMTAYLALRRDIIEGRREPGSKLRVEHLKDEYQVGTSTLREALALLASDALVSFEGRRGFRVAEMSFADFEDITETRITLECHALQRSIRDGNDEWEGDLTAAFHMLGLAEQRLKNEGPSMFDAWEAANRRFHAALVSRCASPWTQHFLRVLYNQAERYRRLLVSNRPVTRNVHGEHEAIFSAAISRDAKTACEVLSKHIRYNLEIYVGMD